MNRYLRKFRYYYCVLTLAASILILFFTGWSLASESNIGWHVVFSDDFNRPALGTNWRWIVDWRSARAYIQNNSVHLCQTGSLMCVIPLPYNDVRVEIDLTLPVQSFSGPGVHAVSLSLRSGEPGAGGNDEGFEITFVPGTELEAPSLDSDGNIQIALDKTYHVLMQISAGVGSVELDGKRMFQKPVVQAHSEINRYFRFSSVCLNSDWGKEAMLDNFRMWAGPNSVSKLPLQTNSPEENRRANVNAVDFIDPANPAPGVQKAIDSLPTTGGVVILPEGEFAMRRHLRLRNNVTLCGQGAGKTILRAIPCVRAAILDLKSEANGCVVTVSQADAEKFRAGDGVCFGESWGSPSYLDMVNKDCIITAISGDKITIAGIAPGPSSLHRTPPWLTELPADAPPKELRHWFPQIYAFYTEFVEVKDLTIIGTDDGNYWGTFDSAALTFGGVADPRVSRVRISGWRGDGISMQTAGEAIVTDNTVTKVYAGYHPGGLTQRWVFTRNLGLDNTNYGLYFCYFNRNGIFYRNVLDYFGGYGWPGDKFDIIYGNICTSAKGFDLEQGEGGGGVVFNNQFAKITVGNPGPGITFDFLLAENQAESFSFVPQRDIQRNMFVGNKSKDGEPLSPPNEMPTNNFFSGQVAGLDIKRYPAGIERRTPAEPPVFPQPVLDGLKFYNPKEPDAGFQKALNQLAKSGGTLLLPAGRYGLAKPLVVTSGVTLAGRGLATVLHVAKPEQTESLIVVPKSKNVTVRDMVILGEYEQKSFRSPAILFQDVAKGELTCVDVRGWEGSAVKVTGGSVQVSECRVLGCAGTGFEFEGCLVICTGNISRGCADGFVLNRVLPESRLEGSIASGNRGTGYAFAQAKGIIVTACNASFNDGDGLKLTDIEESDVVGNMVACNNQSSGGFCGIRLTGITRDCKVHYNNCQDEQMQVSQKDAILEDASAVGNVIRLNLAGSQSKIISKGQDSTVSDNFCK